MYHYKVIIVRSLAISDFMMLSSCYYIISLIQKLSLFNYEHGYSYHHKIKDLIHIKLQACKRGVSTTPLIIKFWRAPYLHLLKVHTPWCMCHCKIVSESFLKDSRVSYFFVTVNYTSNFIKIIRSWKENKVVGFVVFSQQLFSYKFSHF